LNYLRSVLNDGGAPFVAPFEIFERLWILWNLHLANLLNESNSTLSKPHLDYLAKHWKPGKGIGFSAVYSTEDGDDTGLAYDLLVGYGYPLDLDAVLSFEENDHFRCFKLEANPSLDSNIHILGALRRAGCDASHPLVKKVIGFIKRHRTAKGFWFDKWNVSPYYTTSHAIIFCQGFDDLMCADAVEWIINSQRSNGGWGYYGEATAEETAYCLQALGIWNRRGGKIPSMRVEHGRRWLMQHAEPPYPPLWIGKSLYSPELLIQSVVLSALAISQEK
jgi:halimadienyl-diphosphate synthase